MSEKLLKVLLGLLLFQIVMSMLAAFYYVRLLMPKTIIDSLGFGGSSAHE